MATDLTRHFSERLELFFGQASDAQARAYARVQGDAGEGLTLQGSLSGPSCMYAETLPARMALVDQGPGSSLLAAAVVPEPCFWTPAMPLLYTATVELRRGADVLARAERTFGFRTLGAAGADLIYDGKRWVLRGLCCESGTPNGLHDWHQSDLAMVVRNPNDSLCREAGRVGVLIVAELEADDEIRRLSQHPAVGMVSLPCDAVVDLGGWRHNLLLAARFESGATPRVPDWAHVVLIDAAESGQAASEPWRLLDRRMPVIATRRHAGSVTTIAEGRALCDRLQRDLAAKRPLDFDLAGYIV